MGGNKPAVEAVRYSHLVRKNLPVENDMPVFDIVLLGAGNDGHTSSIFPGQEHLLTSSEVYEATYNPNSGQSRIALTGQPIINAEKVIFLIMGKEKADVVSEICMSGDTGPAAYVAHHAREVELFLDQSAAAKLK